MIDTGIVVGGPEMAVPVYIGKSTIYVHTNIKKIDRSTELYQYHEIQYTLDEYLYSVLQDMLNDISRITPHTYTKTAYIGDTDVIFKNVEKGNLTVYFDGEYTIEREGDRITISFEPLEEVTDITISII